MRKIMHSVQSVLSCLTVIFLLFLVTCLVSFFIPDSDPHFSSERFETIKPGWTKKQVLDLLGWPDRSRGDKDGYFLIYENRPQEDPTKFSFLNKKDFHIGFDKKDIVIEKHVASGS